MAEYLRARIRNVTQSPDIPAFCFDTKSPPKGNGPLLALTGLFLGHGFSARKHGGMAVVEKMSVETRQGRLNTKTRPQQPRLAAPNGLVYIRLHPHCDPARPFRFGLHNLEHSKAFAAPLFPYFQTMSPEASSATRHHDTGRVKPTLPRVDRSTTSS